MKFFNVVFSGKQPFKSQQLVCAANEADAKAGLTAALADQIDDFAVVEVEDVTKPKEEAPEAALALN